MNNKRQHEIIFDILEDNPANLSAKEIATRLNKSIATIYKWAEDPDFSGSPIPSDMILPLFYHTNDSRLIEFFCHQLGGLFFPVPGIKHKNKDYLDHLKKVSATFFDAMRIATDSFNNKDIDKDEFENIHTASFKHMQALSELVSLAKKLSKE